MPTKPDVNACSKIIVKTKKRLQTDVILVYLMLWARFAKLFFSFLTSCICLVGIFISPYLANAPIFYPLKTPENQRLSGVFREVENKNTGQKWANRTTKMLQKWERFIFTIASINCNSFWIDKPKMCSDHVYIHSVEVFKCKGTLTIPSWNPKLPIKQSGMTLVHSPRTQDVNWT